MTVHATPPHGEATTPCCDATPFELPTTDRMTLDAAAVTCGVWPCLVCGHDIRVDANARLGQPRYIHVYPADDLHGMAVRGPDGGRGDG